MIMIISIIVMIMIIIIIKMIMLPQHKLSIIFFDKRTKN